MKTFLMSLLVFASSCVSYNPAIPEVSGYIDAKGMPVITTPKYHPCSKSDYIALAAHRYAVKHLTYVSDGFIDNWQHPMITHKTRRGDCEDGAILIASILKASGVPQTRYKIVAGLVNSNGRIGGHAYVIYRRDSGDWITLDWCFNNDSHLPLGNRVPWQNKRAYLGIMKYIK